MKPEIIIFHDLCIFLVILSTLSIFNTKNSVHSVFFLILSFFFFSFILTIFGLEFLALLYIMIYVGAVSVLFLFVVMMANTKLLFVHSRASFPLFISVALMVLFPLYIFLNFWFVDIFFDKNSKYAISNSFNYPIQEFDVLTTPNVIGQILFNQFGFSVVIAGIILFIGLIGSIFLTIDFKAESVLHDSSYAQLCRTTVTAIYAEQKKIKNEQSI